MLRSRLRSSIGFVLNTYDINGSMSDSRALFALDAFNEIISPL